MNKCVFLDRDGTINVDKGYLYLPSDLEFISGVPEALKTIKNKGFLLIVITNQSGVARGKYTISDIDVFHNEINRQLIALGSVPIDAYYTCPHHILGTISPYNIECNCRKPSPTLVFKAASDHFIDLKASYMIGDKDSDIELGRQAHLKSAFKVTDRKTIMDFVNEII